MANVLIVDDAAFMRLTIKQIIESHGHTAIGEAGNGIEAIKQFQHLKPDVVILDITMPDMDGIEALKQIKTLDPNAKIIICSAIGQQKMLAQAIQYGASNFIVKPFENEILVAALEKVLK